MKCVVCNRVTLKPALIVAGNVFGPVCAKKRGLLVANKKHKKPEIYRDEKTLDLFDETK